MVLSEVGLGATLSTKSSDLTQSESLQQCNVDVVTADSILSVIEGYRLKASPFDESIISETREFFIPHLLKMIRSAQPIHLVLPAFPFKSPNTVDKVLGTLPDKAEEVSLAFLQGLCDGIKDVYNPGARLTIVSDGIVYNGDYPDRNPRA